MIWIFGLGLPIVTLIYLAGWLRGFNSRAHMTNWITGYDAGWEDHRAIAKQIPERYGAEEEEE